MISSLFRTWDSERMVTYTVHERLVPAVDRIDRAEELAFVKDGFNFSAAAFGPFWLLGSGLWVALVAYVIFAVVLYYAVSLLGLGELWFTVGLIGLHLLVGAEADTIKRLALDQQGWQAVGTVVGRNASECERRFFETWLPEQPLMRRDSGSGAVNHEGSGVGLGTGGVSTGHFARASRDGGLAAKVGGLAQAVSDRRWWPFGK